MYSLYACFLLWFHSVDQAGYRSAFSARCGFYAFVTWCRLRMALCAADTTATAPSQSLLFVGKYPTDVFPSDTQYGVEVSAIRSPSFDVVAALQFPPDSGVCLCVLHGAAALSRRLVSSYGSKWSFHMSSVNGYRERKVTPSKNGVSAAAVYRITGQSRICKGE